MLNFENDRSALATVISENKIVGKLGLQVNSLKLFYVL